MSSRLDPRPSFQQVRQRHHITLEMLIADIDGSLPGAEILHFDQTGVGRAEVIEAALAALSRLSGVAYGIESVGPLCFTTPLRDESAPVGGENQ